MARKRAVVMADKATREVVRRFRTASEAAQAVGTNRSTIRQCCVRRCMPGHVWHYYRFEDCFDPEEVFHCKRFVPVYVVQDGRLRLFAGVEEASKALGLSETTVSNYAAMNTTYNGLHFGYMRKRIPKDDMKEGVFHGLRIER